MVPGVIEVAMGARDLFNGGFIGEPLDAFHAARNASPVIG